jgi:hypothetical protein
MASRTPKAKATSKAREKKLPARLEEILNGFKALDQVQFDPLKPEARTKARATLPHSFSSQPQPLDYFNLFLTEDL